MSEHLRTDPDPSAADEHGIAEFFANFDQAFLSFDGSVIAERYVAPYLACDVDGTAVSYPDLDAVGEYFQAVVDHYHRMGVRSCRHRLLDVSSLGTAHLVGTVTWDLLDEAGDVVVSWRESYVLVRPGEGDGGGLKVRVSTNHPQ